AWEQRRRAVTARSVRGRSSTRQEWRGPGTAKRPPGRSLPSQRAHPALDVVELVDVLAEVEGESFRPKPVAVRALYLDRARPPGVHRRRVEVATLRPTLEAGRRPELHPAPEVDAAREKIPPGGVRLDPRRRRQIPDERAGFPREHVETPGARHDVRRGALV